MRIVPQCGLSPLSAGRLRRLSLSLSRLYLLLSRHLFLSIATSLPYPRTYLRAHAVDRGWWWWWCWCLHRDHRLACDRPRVLPVHYHQPTSSLSLQRPLSHPCVVRFPPKIPSKFKAQQASSLHLGSSDRRSEETDRVRLDRRLSRRSEGKGGVRRDGWLLPTATSSPSRGTRRGMRRQ